MKRYIMFMIVKLTLVKMLILPNLVYRFNKFFLIKNNSKKFGICRQVYAKIHTKSKGTRIAKITLKKKKN